MRSLILGGGGVKTGYQAGCLQVLLDEVVGDGPEGRGLRFDHVDATSGGCFNAAMLAHGMSGTEIADQWRTMDPKQLVSLNFGAYKRLLWAPSIATHAGIRHVIQNVWRLNFESIRSATSRRYTFNYYNFTSKRVVVADNRELDEDVLLACVSLLMWFPPIRRQEDYLFDAVWCTDGNVREAVRRGADEIWAIWTVADTAEMRDGFLAGYFHLLEAVANARFKADWQEIDAVNESIKKHGPAPGWGQEMQLCQGFDPRAALAEPPPPGRKRVIQHLIQQEVPVHYLLNMSRDRMAAAVEMGVRDTRAYVSSQGIKVRPQASRVFPAAYPVAVRFTETMRGFFMPGIFEPCDGQLAGRDAGNTLRLRVTLNARDLAAFLVDPEHGLTIEGGSIECPLLSGHSMCVEGGTAQLLVNDCASAAAPPSIPRNLPGRKRMLYDLTFTDGRGTRYRLSGVKLLNGELGCSVWRDTTTLFTRIDRRERGAWKPYAAGTIRVGFFDFLAELTTLRPAGGISFFSGPIAIVRFVRFFCGSLWDVYARRLVEYAPF